LLDDRTIVTGSVTTVAEALAVGRGSAPALIERPHIAALWPQVNAGSGIAAVLYPPEHWKSALERVGKLGTEASPLKGARTVALSVKSGSTQTVDVYIDVADAELAERNAELVRAWAVSPPESVEQPWADLLRSARVQVREHTIVLTLDVSSLSAGP
jgi:hypothetical protein